MPKLSQATLEKRFQCGYCAKTLRSRQGLSGHIQFKHMDFFKPLKKVKRVDKKDDMGFFTSKLLLLLEWQDLNGYPKSTYIKIKNLYLNWMYVKSLFEVLDIELNEEDFKTYLLVNLNKLFNPEV